MTGTPRIIGLAGANGAGKDSVGALLADQGYWFFSFTELFRAECRRRGIEITRPNTRMISMQWRSESGLATLIDRSVAEYQKAGGDAKYKGCVFSSLRNPYEADRVHALGGIVLWIDGDPKTRYARIQANAALRGRAGEDNKTYEQFLQEEHDEMFPPAGADATALSGSAVKERCDITITNNSDSLDTLRADVVTALGL